MGNAVVYLMYVMCSYVQATLQNISDIGLMPKVYLDQAGNTSDGTSSQYSRILLKCVKKLAVVLAWVGEGNCYRKSQLWRRALWNYQSWWHLRLTFTNRGEWQEKTTSDLQSFKETPDFEVSGKVVKYAKLRRNTHSSTKLLGIIHSAETSTVNQKDAYILGISDPYVIFTFITEKETERWKQLLKKPNLHLAE